MPISGTSCAFYAARRGQCRRTKTHVQNAGLSGRIDLPPVQLCSPGEFVWRRQSLGRSRGFKSVSSALIMEQITSKSLRVVRQRKIRSRYRITTCLARACNRGSPNSRQEVPRHCRCSCCDLRVARRWSPSATGSPRSPTWSAGWRTLCKVSHENRAVSS
jgi:hypothetical protein